MSTVTFSIRIRKDLREKMRKYSYIDWRSEIERFIEQRIKEEEMKKLFEELDRILSRVRKGGEPAWKTIREFRDRK